MKGKNIWLLAVCWFLFVFDASAAENSSRTSSFQTDWSQTVSMNYQAIALNELLEQWQTAYRLNTFVDRRLDPEQIVSCSVADLALPEAIRQFADKNGLSFCFLGANLYLGPKDAAGQLLLTNALLRQSIRNAGKNNKLARLSNVVPLKGELFCQPQQMLEKIADTASLSWSNLDRMPLDCWNAINLAPFPLHDQIGLLLTGFNVRCVYDADLSVLKPVALNFGGEQIRDYPVGRFPDNYEQTFSQCRFEKDSGTGMVRVTGNFSELAKLEYALFLKQLEKSIEPMGTVESEDSSGNRRSSQARRSDKSGRTRNRTNGTAGVEKEFTGSIKNQRVRDIFSYLSDNTGLTYELDEQLTAKGVTPELRISCEFRRSGQHEMLQILADALQAKYRLEGRKVTFFPAD